MKKLFRLREWLTVKEAAQHLAAIFQEDVTEAELLRLALDGQLTLSVNFVNHARARVGPAVPIQEAKVTQIRMSAAEIQGLLGKDFEGPLPKEAYHGVVHGVRLPGGLVAEISEDVVTIDGIWDLPMVGAEWLDCSPSAPMAQI
jgi:hypothetical protein